MNLSDVLILFAVLILVACGIRRMVRRKREGKCSCGCEGCMGCAKRDGGR